MLSAVLGLGNMRMKINKILSLSPKIYQSKRKDQHGNGKLESVVISTVKSSAYSAERTSAFLVRYDTRVESHSEQWFLNFSVYPNHHRVLGLFLRAPDSVGLRWSLRI